MLLLTSQYRFNTSYSSSCYSSWEKSGINTFLEGIVSELCFPLRVRDDDIILITAFTFPLPHLPPLPAQLLVETLRMYFQELLCVISPCKKKYRRLILRDFPLSPFIFSWIFSPLHPNIDPITPNSHQVKKTCVFSHRTSVCINFFSSLVVRNLNF